MDLAVTVWPVALRRSIVPIPADGFGVRVGVAEGDGDDGVGLATGAELGGVEGRSDAPGPSAAPGRETRTAAARPMTATTPRATATSGWAWPRAERWERVIGGSLLGYLGLVHLHGGLATIEPLAFCATMQPRLMRAVTLDGSRASHLSGPGRAG